MKHSSQIRKNTQLFILPILFFLIFFTMTASAQVSGTVFQDLPGGQYGIMDGGESGVFGVTVTVYPGAMASTTAGDGTWSITAPTGAVRVEFSAWQIH